MSSNPGTRAYDTARGSHRAIASPEQVTLEFPVAGPSVRMLAYCIDGVLITVLEAGVVTILIVAGLLAGWITDQFQQFLVDIRSGDSRAVQESSAVLMVIAMFLVLQLVVEWCYFICVEFLSGGRSLGKAIVGLRVLRDDGLPISFRDCAVRNLLRAVDILPTSYLLGLVAMIASPQGKRLGDLAAGTIVIRLDRGVPALPIELPDDTLSAFRFDREQLARMGATERQLLRQTLRRLDSLPPERRAEALERATRTLCQRLGHPTVAAHEQQIFLQALLRLIETR